MPTMVQQKNPEALEAAPVINLSKCCGTIGFSHGKEQNPYSNLSPHEKPTDPQPLLNSPPSPPKSPNLLLHLPLLGSLS